MMLLAAGLGAQSHPAGKDAEGYTLSVVETRHERDEAKDPDEECLPASRWKLERYRDGRLVDSREIVVECHPPSGHQWETSIRVEPNRIEVVRNGGAFAGWYTQIFQISPWQAESFSYCTVDGNGEWRGEEYVRRRFHVGIPADWRPSDCDQPG